MANYLIISSFKFVNVLSWRIARRGHDLYDFTYINVTKTQLLMTNEHMKQFHQFIELHE